MALDPLQALPAEIILRILEFLPIPTIANLTRATRSWHRFIDITYQDTVYSSRSKTFRPHGSHDLSFLDATQSFAKYYEGTSSWKDLCKRQTLLDRSWHDKTPITRESVLQIGNDAVWRFRADFRRRFFLSTSQQGGFNVTDMDSGKLLWRLPNCKVRPFAHLEYEDGVAVWDREGNALEVWKTDVEGLPRGIFQRTAILPHDCQARGFQLSYNTLCVVSTEGKGYVYDMKQDPPQLKTNLEIENNAVGHLLQNADVVMICMGEKGYHVYDKTAAAFLGAVEPKKCKTAYHIWHPDEPNSVISTGDALSSLPSVEVFPPRHPTRDRLTPIEVKFGAFPWAQAASRIMLEDDEWGAQVLSDSLMVAFSRGGRVFICRDWKLALHDPGYIERHSYMIECGFTDNSDFDLGGWLSVRDNRILFQITERVYVVALADDGSVKTPDSVGYRPSFSFPTSSATQLATPVSFMALFDDCIMSTYTVRNPHSLSREGTADE